MLRIDPALLGLQAVESSAVDSNGEEAAQPPMQRPLARLRNVVERSIVERWITGSSILNAETGAGGSRSLVDRPSRRITSIDISAAMLEGRSRYGSGDGRLLLEAVGGAFPFDDDQFSTVLIDAFANVSDWVKQLDEVVRVTQPGGHVIFDITSSVPRAIFGPPARSAPGRLSVEAILTYARERAVSVEAIVPYGALFATGGTNDRLSGRSTKSNGQLERLLACIEFDERLFAFATFLELGIVGGLTPRCATRLMVVLEKTAKGDGRCSVTERFSRIDAGLECGDIDLNDVGAHFELGPLVWQREFEAHLEIPRNRVFLAALLGRAQLLPLPSKLQTRLPPAFGRELDLCERYLRADRAFTQRIDASLMKALENAITFHGVDIGPVIAPLVARRLAQTPVLNQ